VDRYGVCYKSGYEDNWQDNPMAAKTVKQNVAGRNRNKKSGIKPEEHAYVICRPKIVRYPFNKAAVEECFVKNVNDV
jgi:hypothetical protein